MLVYTGPLLYMRGFEDVNSGPLYVPTSREEGMRSS